MRKVHYAVANSLDNFISREDGGADWILMDDEIMAEFPKYAEKFDAVLIGRKTYSQTYSVSEDQDVDKGQGGGGFMGLQTYVFSRSMKKPSSKKLEFVSGDACEFVRNLKKQPGKDIWLMGGGELAASLFAEDLIDEISLAVCPVLLGSGVPLFPGISKQIDLELIEFKTYKIGVVSLSYRVKH